MKSNDLQKEQWLNLNLWSRKIMLHKKTHIIHKTFKKPGEFLPTADAAAIAAILWINGESIKNNWEYAGRIYGTPDGLFSFTEPQTIRSDRNSDPGKKLTNGMINFGIYHTHAGSFLPTDELYSLDDIFRATFAKEISYIGTPTRHILKLTPVTLLDEKHQASFPIGLFEEFFGPFRYRDGIEGP